MSTILRAYFRTLGLELHDDGSTTPCERAVVIGKAAGTGNVVVSNVEDLGAKIAAAEKLLDRVYGKPKQASEISGPGGEPISLPRLDIGNPEAQRLAHELLALQAGGGASG